MNLICENDIRLLRRILVARNAGDRESAERIITYLRYSRLFSFVLPEEQELRQKNLCTAHLGKKARELVRQYGCILLPQYLDAVYLNSEWRNPRTLYVRLVEPVPELGKLGEIYWLPVGLASVPAPAPAAQPESIFSKAKKWLNGG